MLGLWLPGLWGAHYRLLNLWVLSPHNPGRSLQESPGSKSWTASNSFPIILRYGVRAPPLSPLEFQCFDPWSSATLPLALPCRRNQLFGV